MFCYITENWRGRPLESRAAVVSLISSTRITKGLAVNAVLDETIYEKGIKVSDEEMESFSITREIFHGEWNYSISPKL